MQPIKWKRFIHPAGAYQLEFPAHWDHAQKDEARSCGFGPHDRDDVGLWISLLPFSVDTDRLEMELPKILGQVLPHGGGGGTSEAIRPCTITPSRPMSRRRAKAATTG